MGVRVCGAGSLVTDPAFILRAWGSSQRVLMQEGASHLCLEGSSALSGKPVYSSNQEGKHRSCRPTWVAWLCCAKHQGPFIWWWGEAFLSVCRQAGVQGPLHIQLFIWHVLEASVVMCSLFEAFTECQVLCACWSSTEKTALCLRLRYFLVDISHIKEN